jgi:polynucleotide 5'-kinase involved in rRNA processing
MRICGQRSTHLTFRKPSLSLLTCFPLSLNQSVTPRNQALTLARRPPMLHTGPIIAVCGGKGTGKSTLTRYVTHRLLSGAGGGPVAYLDLDLGQPEATPPGESSSSRILPPPGMKRN